MAKNARLPAPPAGCLPEGAALDGFVRISGRGGRNPAGEHGGARAAFRDPLQAEYNYYEGGVRTYSPQSSRAVPARALRRVAEKAWIINLCIASSISQARPFFKPASGENARGFTVRHGAARKEKRGETEAEKAEAARLEKFFTDTGDSADAGRGDDFDRYCTKIARDLYQLDQAACELQRDAAGGLRAFWAVDAATIEIAAPESEAETGVRFVQVINSVPYAYYSKNDLLFDSMNPRTDVEKTGYGYSVVEQAIDLVTSSINTFMYNAGFFTENKLPRGMLLLNAQVDQKELDLVEDYVANLMGGQVTSQWRVPIIPGGITEGQGSGGGGKTFEWVNLQGNNREMEFQAWMDLQLSAITAMFRKSLEELGLHSQKSQSMFAANTEPKIEASKSLGLGDLLAFLQKHCNKILAHKNPDYVFEFVGYERDDAKITADIDKSEVDVWKTLNEKRAEKGLGALDFTRVKNPADLPMSQQAVQLWSGLQGQGGGGMEGGPDGEADEEAPGGEAAEGGKVDEGAWGELGLEKSNPNHDSGGRFTFGSGGGSREPWHSSTAKIADLKASDWGTPQEIAQMAKMERAASTRREAENALENIITEGGTKERKAVPLKSKNGLTAYLRRSTIGKLTSAAQIKGSPEKMFYQAVANVDKLYSNAIEPWKFDLDPNKENRGLKDRRILYSPMEYGGKIIPVKITVKEYEDKNTQNKLYAVEAVDMELGQIKKGRMFGALTADIPGTAGVEFRPSETSFTGDDIGTLNRSPTSSLAHLFDDVNRQLAGRRVGKSLAGKVVRVEV